MSKLKAYPFDEYDIDGVLISDADYITVRDARSQEADDDEVYIDLMIREIKEQGYKAKFYYFNRGISYEKSFYHC